MLCLLYWSDVHELSFKGAFIRCLNKGYRLIVDQVPEWMIGARKHESRLKTLILSFRNQVQDIVKIGLLGSLSSEVA